MQINLAPQNTQHSTNLRGLSLRAISRTHDYGHGPVEYVYKCLELELRDKQGERLRCCRAFNDLATFNKAKRDLLELYSDTKGVSMARLRPRAPSYETAAEVLK